MTWEGYGDEEPDEFPRRRMRQPCAVCNSHTQEAGTEVPWQSAGETASAVSSWPILLFQFHGACYSGIRYMIIRVVHGCPFPTQVSLDSPDAQERVLTSAITSGSCSTLVLTPNLCKHGECSCRVQAVGPPCWHAYSLTPGAIARAITAVHNPSLLVLWPPGALPAHGAQTYMQGKKTHIHKNE